MLSKEVFVAAGAYAWTAVLALAATMAINPEGNQNTSLPFCIFLFYGLWKISPNEQNRIKPLMAALTLMFVASLVTLPAHHFFPARVNWYDGQMGFAVGAVLITPMYYFTTYRGTAGADRPERDN